MANIFVDGNEIAKKSELDNLLGNVTPVTDSLDNHVSETKIFCTRQIGNIAGYPPNARWGTVINIHSFDKFAQFFFDDIGNVYFRTNNIPANEQKSTPFVKFAWQSDITSLQQQVDDLKSRVDQLTKNQNGGVTSLPNHYVAFNKLEAA